jgi:hypothetical protein
MKGTDTSWGWVDYPTDIVSYGLLQFGGDRFSSFLQSLMLTEALVKLRDHQVFPSHKNYRAGPLFKACPHDNIQIESNLNNIEASTVSQVIIGREKAEESSQFI